MDTTTTVSPNLLLLNSLSSYSPSKSNLLLKPPQSPPDFLNSVNELSELSTALSAFLHDFHDLHNHITSITSAIDAQLPPHLLLLNATTTTEAICAERNPNGTEKSNGVEILENNNAVEDDLGKVLEESNDKLDGIDVLEKESGILVSEEEIGIWNMIEDVDCYYNALFKKTTKNKRKEGNVIDKIDMLLKKDPEKSVSVRKAGEINISKEDRGTEVAHKKKHEENNVSKEEGEIETLEDGEIETLENGEDLDMFKEKDRELDVLKKKPKEMDISKEDGEIELEDGEIDMSKECDEITVSKRNPNEIYMSKKKHKYREADENEIDMWKKKHKYREADENEIDMWKKKHKYREADENEIDISMKKHKYRDADENKIDMLKKKHKYREADENHISNKKHERFCLSKRKHEESERHIEIDKGRKKHEEIDKSKRKKREEDYILKKKHEEDYILKKKHEEDYILKKKHEEVGKLKKKKDEQIEKKKDEQIEKNKDEQIEKNKKHGETDALKRPAEINVLKKPEINDTLWKPEAEIDILKKPKERETSKEDGEDDTFNRPAENDASKKPQEETDASKKLVENDILNQLDEINVPKEPQEETDASKYPVEIDIVNEPEECDVSKKPLEETDAIKKFVEIDILNQPEEVDVLNKPEEINVSKKPDEFDVSNKPEEVDVPNKAEEIDVPYKPGELDVPNKADEINASRKPAIAVLKFLCKEMFAKEMKKHVVDNISIMNSLHQEIAKALKLARNPAKLVLDSIGRFFLQASSAYHYGESRHQQIAVRQASVLILECFVMISSDGIEITEEDKEYAANAAIDWRKRMLKEGGWINTEVVDARGLLLFISGFGIPDGVFSNEDLRDLIRASNVNEISNALRHSTILTQKLPEVIDWMVKINLEIEAVDVVYTFGLEDKCHPETMLMTFLHKKITHTQNGSLQVYTVTMQQLSDLKSVRRCLKTHKIDLIKFLPGFNINEKIEQMEKVINELDLKTTEEKSTLKRKEKETKFSKDPNHQQQAKRSCCSHESLPHEQNPHDQYDTCPYNRSTQPSCCYFNQDLYNSYVTTYSASSTFSVPVLPPNITSSVPAGFYASCVYGGPVTEPIPHTNNPWPYVGQPYSRSFPRLPNYILPNGLFERRVPSSDLYRFADTVVERESHRGRG